MKPLDNIEYVLHIVIKCKAKFSKGTNESIFSSFVRKFFFLFDCLFYWMNLWSEYLFNKTISSNFLNKKSFFLSLFIYFFFSLINLLFIYFFLSFKFSFILSFFLSFFLSSLSI